MSWDISLHVPMWLLYAGGGAIAGAFIALVVLRVATTSLIGGLFGWRI